MADLILTLKSLKAKADAAGRTTTATNTLPSLCPKYNTITGYVTNGSSVVTISGSYSSNQLVKDADVTLGSLLTNPVTVSGISSVYNGTTLNLVVVTNKPLGSTVYFKVGSGSWTTTIPTSTNAGTWSKIYWYATSTTSYKAKYSSSSPGSVSSTISKASRTLHWTVFPNELEYGEYGNLSASPNLGVGDGTISYSSSNTSIAYISSSKVYGGSGSSTTGSTCTITATISAGTNWLSASCNYTLKCYNRYNGYQYVDLDLPSGAIWATRNIGATNQWNYGNYYRYGNPTPYAVGLTIYEGEEDPLSLSRDAARLNWGGAWHTPTASQFYELALYTTSEWVRMGSNGIGDTNGVYGRKFASTKDSSKYIFFPAANYYSGDDLPPVSLGLYDSGARYWTSTPGYAPGKRNGFYTTYGATFILDDGPGSAYPVRGVCDKKT